MKANHTVSRRKFLSTTAGALAIPYFVPSTALGKGGAVAPSERITLGLIGAGGMGRGNMRGFLRNPDAQAIAVCDVDQKHAEQAARDINEKQGNDDCKQYADFRELLARDDIDAVCVATPDHWHAINCVAAANAKKHIYCQKPMTHTFAEGQAVVEAARRNRIIFQVGSQQRSRKNFRHAVELVRNGHIGRVRHIEIGLPTGHKGPRGPAEQAKVQEVPAHIDYDFWCGPSPKHPYIPARLHFNWRWHLSYGGGQLMDWIGHHNDIGHWGVDMDRSGPVEVQAADFVYPSDRTVYDSAWRYEVWCRYAGGLTTCISNEYERGTRWIGDDGWVFVSRGRMDASERAWTDPAYDPGPVRVYHSPEHHRNFLDGVKTGKECICPAETGHRSITPGHLGLLSQALGGRKINWDPASETVVGDPAADALLKRVDYRDPWTL